MLSNDVVTSYMSTPTMYSVEEITAAREWLIDCFPNAEYTLKEATGEQIWNAIARYFEGGIAAFLLTCEK